MDVSAGKKPGDKDPNTEGQEYLLLAIHDLNNCLGGIMASAELLALEIDDPKPRERIAVLEEKVQQARVILERLASRCGD